MSDDYYERLRRCESNMSRARYITKKFRKAFYVSSASSVLILVCVFARLIARVMSLNILLDLASLYLIVSSVCAAGILWFGSFAVSDKEEKSVFYVILFIIARTAFDFIGTGGLRYILLIYNAVSAGMWIYCKRFCGEWQELRNEEGYPDFNPILITDKRIIPNTNARTKSASAPPPENSYMDELYTEGSAITDKLDIPKKPDTLP